MSKKEMVGLHHRLDRHEFEHHQFPPLRDSMGEDLAVTPCVWSDPRPLPQHSSSSPLPALESNFSPSTSHGAHKVGQGRDPGRKGLLLSELRERCEHPRNFIR